VISAINAMATRSGSDYPKAQLDGLLQTALRVAKVRWRAGAMRVVMLSADAAYHVAGDYASTGANNIDALRDALTAASIFPVFSVTADVAAIYQDLVAQLGFGAVVTLTSNSANFSDAVRAAMAAACGAITHSGADGADIIDGTSGDDGIYGGLGADAIDGLDGVDVLRGGQGDDTMEGGMGADRFVVSLDDGDDIITDFEDGLDRLDLSSIAIDIAAAAILSATAVAGGIKIVRPGASVTLTGMTPAQFDLTDVVLIDGNAAAKAVDDAASTSGTAPVTIDVLANDTDLENDALTVVSVGTPGHGTAVIDAGGTITYTAAAGVSGVDTFTYGISDGSAAATGSVTVTVAAVLIGGVGSDVLTGTANGDIMDGGAGADTIFGLKRRGQDPGRDRGRLDRRRRVRRGGAVRGRHHPRRRRRGHAVGARGVGQALWRQGR
jgi:Ca2+-binding RTX toxin-like protein